MWQSRVQIENYTIVYFDCIAAFKVMYHWAYTLHRLIRSSCIHKACMSSALKFSDMSLQTQWCDQNIWQNNLWFLHWIITWTAQSWMQYSVSHIATIVLRLCLCLKKASEAIEACLQTLLLCMLMLAYTDTSGTHPGCGTEYPNVLNSQWLNTNRSFSNNNTMEKCPGS